MSAAGSRGQPGGPSEAIFPASNPERNQTMKSGKSLAELSAEIIRRAQSKKDYAVRPDHLPMGAGDSGLALKIADADTVAINHVAHGQLAGELDIPKRYYDRMLAHSPRLLAENVNEWLIAKPETRTVRTLDK